MIQNPQRVSSLQESCHELWYRDRQEFLDRLMYLDRVADRYVEVYTRAGTANVMFVQSERLTEHRHGQPRVETNTVPQSVHLPLGQPVVAEEAPPAITSAGQELHGSDLRVPLRFVQIDMTGRS